MPPDRYPLAPLQRGMLFHAMSTPESTMYVEQHRLDLDGDVDVAAFRTAWRSVCARHAVLRTAFDVRQPDRPVQVVRPDVEPPLVFEDWRGLSDVERAAREAADRERGFDLSSAPLFRLRLARLGDRAWRLLWTHHHAILDGWSVGVVLREVAGSAPPAEAPAYADFVVWTGRQDLDRARRHWTGALAGFTEPTPLGIARTVGPDRAPHERIGRRLPRDLTERLDRYARAHDVTVETLLTGACAVVLGMYSGTDDVVFGVTSPGRSGPLPGLDRMVGLLINTLPARVRLDRDLSVTPWLRELDRPPELEHTPLDRVQAWSDVPAGRRLFDSILVVEDFPVEVSRLRFGEARATGWSSVQQTNYPLTLLAVPRERLVLEALFDTELLDRRLAGRLLGHLETVLDGLTTARLVGDLDPMRPAERAAVTRLGASRQSFPAAVTVPERFVAWARRQPDRIAVCAGDQRVTYGTLLARTAALAGRLRGLGVGPGVLVGVDLPRGVELVVAVLAVACAGGGYVPVDRRYPAARVRSIMDDAAVAVLLTDREPVLDPGPPVIRPDHGLGAGAAWTEERRERSDRSDEGRRHPTGPRAHASEGERQRFSDVAYVIYTSGSTGTPKGVVVEHRQLARLFDATRAWCGFGPDDVWTLFHSIAFDFSVWELWGALAHGGRLVVVPDEVARDPAAFRRLLLAEGVTVLNQTPSAFRGLVHADLEESAGRSAYRLRWVVLGGEALDVPSLRPWLDRYGDARPWLVNMYGITETTVHVTRRLITRADLDTGVVSPIGGPIPDLAVRVVDRHGRLVPLGVPGELHVGGAGVARGYLNRPELTAERFVEEPGERWYRTGDRARWLADGGLEFLGRLDDQVKIRGYRIEPGEIESVLNGHPRVRESVVMATEGPGGHQRLTAYVVTSDDAADLREWLSDRLPDHLVPAGFVTLDRLPLTPNGKVDRAALTAAVRPGGDGPENPPPGTDTERILADVWAEVLGRDRVGVNDNFFALGGDSILTIQVVARASRRGVSITPAQLFTHQTVAALASVATPVRGAAVDAEQGEVTGEVPATPTREWFHRLALPHAEQWNLPVVLVARQPVRPDRLATALTALVAHHDLLRTRVVDGRTLIRPVSETDPVPVDEFPADRFAELVPRVQAGLDLARGPLLRAAVFTGAAGEPDRVLLAAHHLVVDTVSWRILLEDLETAYRQVVAGAPVTLPAKTTSFARWAGGLGELARSERIAREVRWWLDRVPVQPVPPPAGPADEPGLEGDTDVAVAALDESATAHLLADANRAYRTRPDELLLAALALAMTGGPGAPSLMVDVEGHGRDIAVPDVDVSRTVGWFTTLTPVWLDLSGIDRGSPAAVVKAVKEQLRAVPGRGAPYGLARWLRDDDLARRLAELPRAGISFNYLGRLDPGVPTDASFALTAEPVAAARHPANPRPYPIDVVAGVRDGRLRVYLAYSARRQLRSTMERLAAAYLDALRGILDHCMTPSVGGPTPSDFPLAGIGQDRLDRLVAERGGIEDLYPLAPLQRGLLFHTLANPDSGVYFEQFSLRLDGPLDVDAFERAWRALLDRHAVLRASVVWQGMDVPHLVVHERVELPLTRHDWAADPDRENRLAELLTRDRVQGFELTRAPLTRLHLVRVAEQRWHLVWSHHHILLDGWSVSLLIQEIFDTYEAIRAGSYRPAPPPRPYRDHIGYLAGLDHSGAWAYWRRVLSGVTGPTPLGADRPVTRTGRRDADYARVHRRLPPDRSATVREFARTHRLTLDTVLHGAWALVLAGRSGTDDVVFGATSSGRPPALEGVEEMVGLFIATLPARVRVDRDQPVAAWLSGLQRDQVQARQYEHTPLDQIRGWTSVPPDRPLFESVRALENYPRDSARYRSGSVAVTAIETFEQTDFALSFLVVPDEALLFQLWYDALRFTPETGEHILRSAETLVLVIAADPDRTVGEVLAEVPAAPSRPAADARLESVEPMLRGIPLVRDAVVAPAADGRRLVGYLVPDLAAAERDDQVAGGLAEQHVADWRAVHDRTFAGARPADPEFDTVGWDSSYTGEPIAADAMAEWRGHTLDRIRALRPARVLEIGCGTGLLSFGLLDDCERYVGTDFSPVCLAQVRDRLAAPGRPRRAAVTLLERVADDTTGLEPGGFDVVVLNSVAQYFPSAAYLDRVLDAAVRLAAPGGAIVVGDLRHHGLLAAFHVSVQLYKAADLVPVHELHRRVTRSLEHERELLVDPRYLVSFAAVRSGIGAVELMVKRGRHDTELTRYRYDAVLRLGPPPLGPARIAWHDWRDDVLSASEIGWLLDHADTDAVGITGAPNARVAADVEAARLLGEAHSGGTAGDLRTAAGKAAGGLDPEELYRLGERRGWSVAVAWATNHADGTVNALFRRGPERTAGTGALHAAGPSTSDSPEGTLTNAPLRGRLAEELERRAWAALRPEHTGVSRLLIVDELPRTADGRVDLAALPAADPEEVAAPGTVPPRTADELRLCLIWARILRTRSVDMRASFFDLGGDSLLAIRLVDEVARAFDREVPLAVLLREPTVEGMAAALRAEPRPWTPLVEITGGDGPPFFCVHPAGGTVLCYAELARLVDPHPFCALQARGVEGDDPPYDDLPAMAARYLQDVRDRQPAGPYHLGGWSLGGLVAYEMAQQLRAGGADVGALVLIETATPDLVARVPDEDLLRELDVTPSEVDSERGWRLMRAYTTHLAAAGRYRPRPYAGRTCLVRAERAHVPSVDYGWGALLNGQWDVVEVPGDHHTIVRPPHVERLAEVLRELLDR